MDLIKPEKCIFLAGSARGGTTYALTALKSHPLILGSHEPLRIMINDPKTSGALVRLREGEYSEKDHREFVNWLHVVRASTHRPPFFDKSLHRYSATFRNLMWTLARSAPFTEPIFERVSAPKLTGHHRLLVKNRPFPGIEKLLLNVSSHVIVLLRHPCAVVLSWRKGIELGVMPRPDGRDIWRDYGSLLEPLGFSAKEVEEASLLELLTTNWLVDTLIYRQITKCHPMTYQIIFENLISNPKSELQNLFGWLELNYEQSVDDFLDKNSRKALSLRKMLGSRFSYFSVQGDRNIDSWKRALSDEEKNSIYRFLDGRFDLSVFGAD